ncbi:hypothetical protein [Phenylobacterium sp.]|uniref:hypothetical protein n=1 Tax=Phenylobacterium sp. TaxID=1871053 RepID=UPI002F95D5D9
MAKDRQITVRPVAGGWCVECEMTGELMFLSGARAEEKARSLAACLAELGSDVRLSVHDRQGGLIATRRYFGDAGLPKAARERRLELA